MTDQLCEQLTQEYNHAQTLGKKLKNAFEKGKTNKDFSSARKIKSTLRERIEKIREKFTYPDKIFLEELDKEKTLKKIKEITSSHPSSLMHMPAYRALERIFQSLDTVIWKKDIKFTERSYDRFVKGLVNRKGVLSAIFKTAPLSKKEEQLSHLFALIHSVFLNKFLKSDTVLNIKKTIPKELEDYFGCFLMRGKISVEKVGDRLGTSMFGGVIKADIAGDWACDGIKGGVVIIKKAGYNLASRMDGGTVYAKEVGDSPGNNKEDGTLLVEKWKMQYAYFHEKTYFYNNQDQNYYDLPVYYATADDAKIYPLKEKDLSFELESFKDEKEGLRIIESLPPNPSSITEDMKGGILVLRQAPTHNIGEGMEDGILIIEDLATSKEEVRKRLSPHRKGGVIMMRVPDPYNPGETILEEVG